MVQPVKIVVVDENGVAKPDHYTTLCSYCTLTPLRCKCAHPKLKQYHPCSTPNCVRVIPSTQVTCFQHRPADVLEKEIKAIQEQVLQNHSAIVNRTPRYARLPGSAYGRLRNDARWHEHTCNCVKCDSGGETETVTPIDTQSEIPFDTSGVDRVIMLPTEDDLASLPLPSFENVDGSLLNEMLPSYESEMQPVFWDFTRCGYSVQNRRRLKPTMVLEDVHFRLHVGGSRDDIDTFHYLVHELDSDYPLDPFRARNKTIMVCKKCEGMLWRKASLQPEQLRRLGRQCGIRLRVTQYREERKCRANDKVTRVTTAAAGLYTGD